MTDDARARRADVRLGTIAVALSALALLWLIPSFVRAPVAPRPLAMAPWFLPGIAAALFGLAGAALALSARRRGNETFHAPPTPPAPLRTGGLAAVVAALLAWLLLMPVLGALATATAVTLALLLLDPSVSRTAALAVGLGLPPLAWLAFTRLAGTPLPSGIGSLSGL